MLDLHCHILPGVDDGASDIDEAVGMASCLVSAGFTHVAASPHMGTGPGGDVPVDVAARARDELQARLQHEDIRLEVLPNGEHHICPALFGRMAAGDVVPVGGSSRWLLVEQPWSGMSAPEQALFRLQLQGYRLLLAHPERHGFMDVDMLARLFERGVRMQLELGSFVGTYGPEVARRADALVQRGAAHVLATDLHGSAPGATWLSHALDEVQRRYGDEALARGTQIGPSAILADSAPEEIPPMVSRR